MSLWVELDADVHNEKDPEYWSDVGAALAQARERVAKAVNRPGVHTVEGDIVNCREERLGRYRYTCLTQAECDEIEVRKAVDPHLDIDLAEGAIEVNLTI